MFLYDDYTKPLPADLARQVAARVVTRETFDSTTKTTKEVVVAPLKLAENGQYLEAQIDQLHPSRTAPAQLTVKAKFKRDELLIISPFDSSIRRPTRQTAEIRNKLVVDVATDVTIIHASPGGHLDQLTSSSTSSSMFSPS